MPVAAIAGIALAALVLLHLSDSMRAAGRIASERSRLAEAQLASLVSMPAPLPEPEFVAPSLPVLSAASQPSAVPAAGLVSFQAARVHVGSAQRMAVVNLRRERSTAGAAPVGWFIAPVTAKPGVDYETPTVQVARFNDGQDVRALFIPIKPAGVSPRPERRFIIKLRKTPGAPAFGAITETEVVIAGSG